LLAVAFSPDIPHEEEKTEQFTRYIAICIEKKFYEEIYREFNDKAPPEQLWGQFAVSQQIMIYINSFFNECESKLAGHNDILDALATIITHSLIRAQLSVAASKSVIYEKFEIQKVVEYMQQNFGKKLTIKSLAKMVSMSESSFIRLFKKETGLSPMDFLIKLRIDKAKKLIRAGSMNITEVSLHCGFSSTSHFSTSFTKHAGVKPSEFQSKS
jgi:AraC-like DNA-binding protein